VGVGGGRGVCEGARVLGVAEAGRVLRVAEAGRGANSRSGLAASGEGAEGRCQYLYFCTSKASTFVPVQQVLLCQSGKYFWRSKASEQPLVVRGQRAGVSICTFVPVKQVLLYQ
jgi:hypothetical protein